MYPIPLQALATILDTGISTAIAVAAMRGWRIDKLNDPTEGAQEGIGVHAAREVALVDPSLLVVQVRS